ncbi:MAG: lipid A biosynthesis acyltransferase [Comamonadaceae bacterium]|nr:MAG: lipid A biosynthesis acyltransferase [Comamonadaceae bacterium]
MKWLASLAGNLATRAGILFMQVLAFMPLRFIRGLGTVFGLALYKLVRSRRRVVETNLRLCFPQKTAAERDELARQIFIHFAQSWLDRSWLWHGPEAWVHRRIRLKGVVEALAGNEPIVGFVPHFFGMDAAWGGVARRVPRIATTIFTDQSNKLVNDWILRGRRRFGTLRLFGRSDGVKPIVKALREGQPLYLLPDMDFGPDESIFVPFYGIPTATISSLSRFARLGKATVVPFLSRITPYGYEIEAMPAWTGFPGGDELADTAFMNARLEEYINRMPDQYYWVHKRFKTRPEGDASFY